MTSPQSHTHATHPLVHSDYAKSSRELIDFVGLLRSLGQVQFIRRASSAHNPRSAHIDLELPRIVVIGNQSAGKSSLVEAISGVRLRLSPRRSRSPALVP